MAAAIILRCTCEHSFQDSRYGLYMRVHNQTVKTPGWRCTVCSNHKRADDPEVRSKAKSQ